MRILTVIAASFLTVLLPVQAQVRTESQAQPLEMSYCDLSSNPAAFVGKLVRVRAIYRFFFESRGLYQPVCCPHPGTKIWVDISLDLDKHSQTLFHKIDGAGVAMVVFDGRLEGKGSYGTFAEPYQFVVEKIVAIEQSYNDARGKGQPSWVPRNCAPVSTNATSEK